MYLTKAYIQDISRLNNLKKKKKNDENRSKDITIHIINTEELQLST